MRGTVTNRGRTVGYDYGGGEYIELLLFGMFGEPFEVINVWDYELGAACIPNTRQGVRQAVLDWFREWDEEEGADGWFEDYIDNHRW